MRQKERLLLVLAALAVTVALFVPAIPQDPAYHRFADGTARFGIPNFWNVVSNLPFLAVGLAGVLDVYRGRPAILGEFHIAYLIFFAAVALVAPGSAYYHLNPNNATLVWDRLPMTVAFMALFSIVLAEYVSVALGRRLLWPLLVIGVVSVFYWDFTEAQGRGDLRLYGLVQFLPMLLIPPILLLFRSRFGGTAYLWAVLGAYAVAKAAELLDEPIFRIFHPLSGHALKHLLAALGVYIFLAAIRRRSTVSPSPVCRHEKETS
ncbi:ceramidase domain-containing protein [Methylococcus mesophilus]|uniref:ceramidase domain-containing protein n=1 Tax=Methylococcus mesophilus TaxID=2993564 RepID=UPI00224B4AF1|nr:ceramidase domain-containing protein [Methylococcus mesophilus]UZR28550.1 ceramidase domain-containing protein [Methylococcus mesophilus]